MSTGKPCASCGHPRSYHGNGTEPCLGPRLDDHEPIDLCGCPHFTVNPARQTRREDQPLPVRPANASLRWWGSECRECQNTTPLSMTCDSCKSDASTVPLYEAVMM